MGRRKSNDNILTDLFGIARLLPWKVGVILAVVSFGALHWYASGDAPTPQQLGADMAREGIRSFGRGLAGLMQYLIPPALLLGSLFSYLDLRNVSVSSTIKGAVGEAAGALAAKVFLDSKVYRSLNNVTLQTENGTTQIDHIIVSRFGIFVIEAKNYAGWIFGSADQAEWTQSLPGGKKYKFQNPLHQNYRHIKAVAEFLGVPEAKLHSVVMFWGECEFKTPMPANVMLQNYSGYIKAKAAVLFFDEEVTQMVDALQSGRMPTRLIKGLQTKKAHLESLQDRHGSTTKCPKCGSDLVERVAKSGPNAGNRFLACTAFPKCRFTRNNAG
jgi:restriction system protein